jgi:hypothetical protein
MAPATERFRITSRSCEAKPDSMVNMSLPVEVPVDAQARMLGANP